MNMQVPNTSVKAIALIGFKNSQGVLLFPSDRKDLPGIPFDRDSSLQASHQVLELLLKKGVLSDADAQLNLVNELGDVFDFNDENYWLFVGTCDADAPSNGKTFSEILREMPKNKTRAVFLRALQELAGGI